MFDGGPDSSADSLASFVEVCIDGEEEEEEEGYEIVEEMMGINNSR